MEQADGPSVRLPARATRGQRLNKLIEDEDEADKAFWGQDAFNEEDQEEYVSEEEEQDVFDSDFDDDEDMEEDGEEDEDDRPRKRRKPPPGAAPKRTPRKAATAAMSALTPKGQDKSFEAVFQDRMAGAGVERKVAKPKSATVKRPRVEEEPAEWAEAGIERRSKRAVVVERERERGRELEEAGQKAKSKKPVAKKKPVVEERRLTQEEMLAEAAQTEIANLQSLEIMLAREEEIKRKAIIHKEAFAGPQIRYHSKGGHTVLEFTRVDDFPSVIHAKAPPYPPKSLCAVTGLPAKYKDPLTGLPYATLEAFKVLRERWNDRGKRVRPLSSIKLDGTDNLGPKRGQKSARDSPAPGKKPSRLLRRASPRDSQSPGASSPEDQSPGPASPAELPPSRLGMQSGATQSDRLEQLPAAPKRLPSLHGEQPLPSLQDVTFDDFDVGMDAPAPSRMSPIIEAPNPVETPPTPKVLAPEVEVAQLQGDDILAADGAVYDASASGFLPSGSDRSSREGGLAGDEAADAPLVGRAIEASAAEGPPLVTSSAAGTTPYESVTEGLLQRVPDGEIALRT